MGPPESAIAICSLCNVLMVEGEAMIVLPIGHSMKSRDTHKVKECRINFSLCNLKGIDGGCVYRAERQQRHHSRGRKVSQHPSSHDARFYDFNGKHYSLLVQKRTRFEIPPEILQLTHTINDLTNDPIILLHLLLATTNTC